MLSTTRPVTQGMAITLIAAAGLAGYLGAFHPSFLSDDWNHIHEAAWSLSGRPFFRPVIDFTFWLDRSLFGLTNAIGFHATNVAYHVLNAILVFLIARRLLGSPAARVGGAPGAALLAGLLFALLASHANAVSWIVGRVDIVSATFGLLALWSYLRFRTSRRVATLLFSLLVFLVATFAKESTFTLPIALLVYEVCMAALASPEDLPAGRKRHLIDALSFLVPLGVHALVRQAFSITSLIEQSSGFDVLLLVPQAFEHSLGGLVPAGVLSSAVPAPGLHAAGYAYGFLGLAASCLVLVYVTRQKGDPVPARIVAIALAFVVMLLPVSQRQVDILYSDLHSRYNYLPSAFCILVLALLVHESIRRARWTVVPLFGLCAALLVVNALHLHRLNRTWNAAGDVTQSIIGHLTKLEADPRPTLVIGLPDRIDHAYVFRNGFGQAMRQNGVRNTYLVGINWNMALPAGAEANRIDVERADGAFVFTSMFGRWRNLRPRDGVYELVTPDRPSFELRPTVDARIQLYSQGRFTEIE